MNFHIYFDNFRFLVRSCVKRDFSFTLLDSSSQTSFSLVGSKDKAVSIRRSEMFQILHAWSTDKHTGCCENNARSSFFHNLLSFFSTAHFFKDRSKERVMVFLKNKFSHVCVQKFRICGVNRGNVPDHTVNVDRNRFQTSSPDEFFNNKKNFLRSPNPKNRQEHASTSFKSLSDNLNKLLFAFKMRRVIIIFSTVGAFNDHGFKTR